MSILIVVNNTKEWKFNIPGAEVISNKAYLTNIEYTKLKNAKVFNLSKSYKYQSNGYYVSLLAAARGHKAIPSISTIQDMKSQAVIKVIGEELDELIQKSLHDLRSDHFAFRIYFGKSVSKKYHKLSLQLFNLFQAPLLEAEFKYEDEKWELHNIGPIDMGEVPLEDKETVEEYARAYFEGKKFTVPKRDISGYDLAILVNPKEEVAPSDAKTIQKFIKAAELVGLSAYVISKEDYSDLAEYDALFIRETTAVNHHTFRFAQRAQAEGLAVVDDPESIIRCTNKVYLAELLKNNDILAPKTIIVHKDNIKSVIDELGFPCVLKQPDSSFSHGVVKVENEQEYIEKIIKLLDKSELVIAQEFLKTDFDWRVGVFDKEPLYACKYYMARKHWQIMDWGKKGNQRFGKVETLPVEIAPSGLIKTAQNICNLIGDSLYGVDIKQVGNKFYVIEVNDNPTIETGVEDSILKDKLYTRIMEIFLKKIRRIKESKRER